MKQSVRNQVAAMAMQSLIAREEAFASASDETIHYITELSFKIADAMDAASGDKPIKSNVNMEFINKVFDTWNKLHGTKLKATSGKIAKIKARLKTFSEEEFLKAINNRYIAVSRSEWHNRPENQVHRNSMDVFIRNDDNVQKFLLLDDKGRPAGSNINPIKFT